MDYFLNNWVKFIKLIPKKIIYYCTMFVLVEATTKKGYTNTVFGDLSAVDAIKRFARIHGISGNGKDEFYNSNIKDN